jgi:tetratricopeptide (TPR) repeat protein
LELRPCYGETEAPLWEGGWSPLRTWTTPRWKYIHTTRPELFDLEQDPGELRNVVDQYAAKAEEFRRDLAAFESSLTVRRGSAAVLSDAERRALAGLGYAGGRSPAQESDQPRRDIKDALIHAEHVHRCMHLIDNNQFDEAERLLEGVVAALPDYAKAWGTLGVCRAKQEDYLAAERHFRKALALDANQNFARIGLGRALFAQNRFQDCVEQLEIAVDHEPTALDAQYFLGEASRRLGHWETSRRAFEAAIKRSPDFAPARVGLADLARDEGRLDDAAELYQGLLQRDPVAAALGLASVYRQQERDAEAVAVLEDFLRRMPRHVEGLTTLARLLATSADASVRNPARAVEAAEQACRLTERRQAGPLMSLSKAYAAAGRTERAIQTAETALTLAREAGSATQAEEIEKALSEYRGGR